ncbi:hypothetical protein C8J56DRAFT_751624, partial [Mycena floridula]
PPSQAADPLIGHPRKMSVPQGQAELFHQWTKTYGDMFQLRIFGTTIMILDSEEAAVELLDKRGAIYSCRPGFIIFK